MKRMFSDYLEDTMISKAVISLAALSLLCAVCTTAGADYTIDSIADGLLSAEALFTDLRLDYTQTFESYNTPSAPIRIVEVTYAQKTTKNGELNQRLRYMDRKVSLLDPNTNLTTLEEDTLASFDGQATSVLYRKSETGKPMKAYVLAGYNPSRFPTYYNDPHREIWYHAGRLLGDILKKYRDNFSVESQSEALHGISTIKVVGTLVDPNNGQSFTMRLWVSPDHNFLPIKRQVLKTGGRLLSEIAAYELTKLPNDTWYPKIIRSPDDPPGAPNPSYVCTYDIKTILIEPIPKEYFSFEFPPNTNVIDDILKISYTTY